jgi:O-antigen/teichoic acid export membrane protein
VLKQLLQNAILSSATKVVGLLVGLASVAITSRVLGPTGRGYIAVVTTMVGLAATFGNLSLGQVALKYAADARDADWLPRALGVLATATAVITVAYGITLSAAFALGYASRVGDVPLSYLLLASAALPLTVWVGYSTSLLLAADLIRESNRAQLAGTLSGVAVVALLVLWLRQGVTGALTATLVGLVVTTVLGGRALAEASGRRIRVSGVLARHFLRDGAKLHLTAIGAYLFSGLDILMVHHYRGAAAAGLFQLAFQLYAPLLLVPQSVMEVLSGKLAAIGPRGLWPFQRRLMLLTIGGMVAAAIVLALVAPLIVRVLAGPAFSGSVPIFRIYLLGIVAATINGIMGVQWIGRGLFLQTSALTFAAGVANFAFNLLFIPRYGATGAAFATVVGVYAIPFTANVALAVYCEREHRRVGAPRTVALEGA